jgi:phage tail tape-measure protein
MMQPREPLSSSHTVRSDLVVGGDVGLAVGRDVGLVVGRAVGLAVGRNVGDWVGGFGGQHFPSAIDFASAQPVLKQSSSPTFADNTNESQENVRLLPSIVISKELVLRQSVPSF